MDPTPVPNDYATSKINTVVRRTCTDYKVNYIERGALVKLNALMRAKMVELAQSTRLLTENTGRTHARVDDVLAAFKMCHVDMSGLIQFGRNCTGIEAAWARFQFPVADRKSDHFEAMYGPKASAHELKFRPENIPDYHRALHPEWIGKRDPKKIETISEQEFKVLCEPTYPWKESPDAQRKRMEKERAKSLANAQARARNQERFRNGITGFRHTDLPNYEDMEYGGFLEDRESCRRMEERLRERWEMEQAKMEQKKEQEVPKEPENQKPKLFEWTTMKRPNILKKRTTILLDQALPLVPSKPKKTYPPITDRTLPPTPPSLAKSEPTASPTREAAEVLTSTQTKHLVKFDEPSDASSSSSVPAPPPLPLQFQPPPSPSQHITPAKLTKPPWRPQSNRQKSKSKGKNSESSPVHEPKTKNTPSLTAPTPKLTTPAKPTPPLRAQSSRQKKPRAETYDPSPDPRKSTKKQKDQQAIAEQQKTLSQIQEDREPPLVTEHKEEPKEIKLKIKLNSDLFSSGPLLLPETTPPRSPLKIKLNLAGIRVKEEVLSDEDEKAGKENGDEDKKAPMADPAVCPKCSLTYPNEQLIGCDQCEEWFHWQCVNVFEEPTEDQWFCPECTRKRKKAAKRSTTSDGGPTPAKRGRPSQKR